MSTFDAHDAAAIAHQREMLGRIGSSLGVGSFGFVVDVGWPVDWAVCPPALFGIVRAARLRAVDVVAVERISRFARDRSGAVRIATILCDAGVQILEAGREKSHASDPGARSRWTLADAPGTVRIVGDGREGGTSV